MKHPRLLFTSVLAIAACYSSAAFALAGYVHVNTNMRAGPGPEYPLVGLVHAGSGMEVFGCVESRNWCEVETGGYHGWISGRYLETMYNDRYVRMVEIEPAYAPPVVTFSVGTYWDNHYRDRSFYRDRDRYDHGGPRGRGPGPDRGHDRDDRRGRH